VLGDLFYQLGAAVGGLGSHVPGKAGAEADAPDDRDPDDPLGHAGGLAVGAAGAWLLTRVLRPRPVSWPRVVVAGVAATLLAELAARTFEPDLSRERTSHADDPEALLRRLGAGVAVAAGYASLLYPRLPGSPLVRGLAFGALEVAATPSGGLARMAADIPGLRFPLQQLAVSADEERGPIAHMAFGLGLGLFYMYPRDGDPDEDIDDDIGDEE
jgi:hypothetical protein